MKLYVHGGLHKTATSAFQTFCHQNAETLRGLGLFYPRLESGVAHHHQLPLALTQCDWPDLAGQLAAIASGARAAGCADALVSAEDFENTLVDVDLAARFETVAREAGFEGVEWFFVSRDPWSYFNSLYAELSKHGIAVSYRSALAEAVRFGSWTRASSTFQWKFVFDYDRYFARFRAATVGPVHFLRYEDFVSDGLGMPVFAHVFADRPGAAQGLRPLLAAHRGGRNSRLGGFRVEFNYVANFFMISNKTPSLLFLWAFLPLAAVRAMIVGFYRHRFAARFHQRFPH